MFLLALHIRKGYVCISHSSWLNKNENHHWAWSIFALFFAIFPGYYVRFISANKMKISAKWETDYDYYINKCGKWVCDQWLHLIFTWKAEEGITVYLNGCDMDPNGSMGYAYSTPRGTTVTHWYPFRVGSGITEVSNWQDADGTTIDELYIWQEVLSPMQIWELYIQGGTMP